MYRIQKSGYDKCDPEQRWALPDRIFLACGACHILAYAFLERHGTPTTTALWLKPAPGYLGNHIVVATRGWLFDYHGFSDPKRFFGHTWKKARRWWPGWDATLVALPHDVLISEAKSRTYDGLWLREPGQFWFDPLPRARAFLDRFANPPASPVHA